MSSQTLHERVTTHSRLALEYVELYAFTLVWFFKSIKICLSDSFRVCQNSLRFLLASSEDSADSRKSYSTFLETRSVSYKARLTPKSWVLFTLFFQIRSNSVKVVVADSHFRVLPIISYQYESQMKEKQYRFRKTLMTEGMGCNTKIYRLKKSHLHNFSEWHIST